jgi:hypothetical protein
MVSNAPFLFDICFKIYENISNTAAKPGPEDIR